MSMVFKVLFWQFVVLVITSLLVPPLVFAQGASNCTTLSRNLKVGMSGEDVRALQIMLNSEPQTRLAESGPGSLGFETTYFGEKTSRAVVRFQELFRHEVLSPAGLSVGNGFVGSYTRAKLTARCLGGEVKPTVNTPPTAPTVLPIPATTLPTSTEMVKNRFGKPYLITPSTYVGIPGSTIKVTGSGLPTTGNTVHIGTFTIAQSSVDSRGSLNFVLPGDTPRGVHALWVETSIGATNKLLFIVSDGNAAPPVATAVTPNEGTPGTLVVVTGSGFTPTGNRVQGGFGVITNIASPDGKTLQFTLTPTVPGMTATQSGDVPFLFRFYVINEHGMSKPIPFTLKL